MNALVIGATGASGRELVEIINRFVFHKFLAKLI